ncbi:MAG: septum formation protein Maf [Acidobacteria bacterium RIFCSPHIGHO2_01_FULL_67_28]|nr:MAG: septum formation protein Maf [Acidobacteria bacterium RIFCSPHIGHO2_01_FULL_67_28]
MKRLILASASPRRRELLRQAGFTFEVVAPEVDETYPGGEDPAAFAERLALAKAAQIAQRFTAKDDVVVLGADTVVVADGEVLGKPVSADDARAMLRKLSGIAHRVITGVALAAPGAARRAVGHEVTRVFFRPLTEEEITAYVATGEPLDKAGAYAAQGRAARFVTRVEGCYFNVVGLPVALVDRLLRDWNRD